MNTVAYLYLPTPSVEDVPSVFEHIVAAGISVTHFGPKDPPKRWSGTTDEMSHALLERLEQNKQAFMRDASTKVELDVQLNYDSRWSHSTISLSGPVLQKIEHVAVQLATRLQPFLCILGTLAAGKGQPWRVLGERVDCPLEIKSLLRAA